MRIYFHTRLATPTAPAGITVSRHKRLPGGCDFTITEYTWGAVSLWFVESECWNADDRQAAHDAYIEGACAVDAVLL